MVFIAAYADLATPVAVVGAAHAAHPALRAAVPP